ncbi:60S ribosomal protein L37a [Nannospalax galili]|uniref:60S ribosomal protein L37a n=1 Tax=Nannospalax galili TaxID=1026970 RepID=UPI0004ED62C4|nr:60S ribosomal protein L37a [Nannospalax galili]
MAELTGRGRLGKRHPGPDGEKKSSRTRVLESHHPDGDRLEEVLGPSSSSHQRTKMEIGVTESHLRTEYTVQHFGRTKRKRPTVGIRHCGSCMKTVAGGSWAYGHHFCGTVKSDIRRLKELKDQ